MCATTTLHVIVFVTHLTRLLPCVFPSCWFKGIKDLQKRPQKEKRESQLVQRTYYATRVCFKYYTNNSLSLRVMCSSYNYTNYGVKMFDNYSKDKHAINRKI